MPKKEAQTAAKAAAPKKNQSKPKPLVVRFKDQPQPKKATVALRDPSAAAAEIVELIEIPPEFKNLEHSILLSRIQSGVQPQADWKWMRAMYLFLLQACYDIEDSMENCTEEAFVLFTMQPENWVPLSRFLEANQHQMRGEDPPEAKAARLDVYRSLPFFSRVCAAMDSVVPPVAGPETVAMTEANESPMETVEAPSHQDLGSASTRT